MTIHDPSKWLRRHLLAVAGALTVPPVLLRRSSSEKVLQRALTEERAGRHAWDVLETNGPEMEVLHRKKLPAEFRSRHFKNLPFAAFPKHRRWVKEHFNFFTTGCDTSTIKPNEVLTRYEDLLHPRFASKLGIEAGDTDWFAAVVKHMGEAKGMAQVKKFAAAKPQICSGHTALAELVPSGELPIAANIYNRNIERLIVKACAGEARGVEPHRRPAQRQFLNAAFCAPARRAAVHRCRPRRTRRPSGTGPGAAAAPRSADGGPGCPRPRAI